LVRGPRFNIQADFNTTKTKYLHICTVELWLELKRALLVPFVFLKITTITKMSSKELHNV